MGLDLHHYKATMTPPGDDEERPFRADDLDDEALDQLGFRQYLQTIADFDYPTRIVIAPDQTTLNRLQIEGNWYFEHLVASFVGRPGELIDQVERVERRHQLDRSQRMTYINYQQVIPGGVSGVSLARLSDGDWSKVDWHPPATLQKKLDQHPGSTLQRHIEINYPVPDDYLGLYVQTVGYQRKGMTSGFYKEFGSPFLCWRRADVERAASFVSRDLVFGEHEPGEYYVKNFREQFLDTFEEGRSLFGGSY